MLLRGLLKFIAVVVAAGVVGAGLGIGLAELSGGGDTTAVAPTTASSPPGTESSTVPATSTSPAPATATAATSTGSTAPPAAQGTARTNRAQVLSAVLYPAKSASGRARRRARVVVRVRVTNRGLATLAPKPAILLAGTDEVPANTRAGAVAGDLLKPLARGASATGELRFETAGAFTQRLTSQPQARLRIAGRTVALSITLSSSPPPPG